MKAVTPYALGMKLMRYRVVIRNRSMRAVKRRVEAGDLRQVREIGENRTDRRQIVRLMQGREVDEPFQSRHDPVIDQHRPIEFRTAMHDTMSDSDRMNAKLVPQPLAGYAHGGGNVRHGFNWIGAFGQGLAARTTGAQARTAADAIDLALDLSLKSSLAFDRKDLEFDA